MIAWSQGVNILKNTCSTDFKFGQIDSCSIPHVAMSFIQNFHCTYAYLRSINGACTLLATYTSLVVTTIPLLMLYPYCIHIYSVFFPAISSSSD